MDTNQNTGFTSGMAGAPPQERPMQERWREGGSETTSQKTRQTAANLKQGARDMTHNLKAKGTEKASELKNQGKQYVETRKGDFAGQITGCGSAIHRVAQKLRDENDTNVAKYTDMVADRVEQIGNYFQSRELGSIYRDVENMARRRPELVFGGLFVAGLALSRFLKATSHRDDYSQENEDYWVEDQQEGSDMSLTGPVGPTPSVQGTGTGMGMGNNPVI